MSKNLLSLFCVIFCFITSCDKSTIKTSYIGTIKIRSEYNGNFSAEQTYDIELEIEDNSFKRKLENSNRKCKGEVVWTNETIQFSSSNCPCHCDCSPCVDCSGDLILGKFDIIKNQNSELHLENEQVLAVDTSDNPSYVEYKTVLLKAE